LGDKLQVTGSGMIEMATMMLRTMTVITEALQFCRASLKATWDLNQLFERALSETLLPKVKELSNLKKFISQPQISKKKNT
jgi:hypothetical protein